MLDNLKTCFFGGYKRVDTLLYIGKLTDEIEMLEIALNNKKEGLEYSLPKETEKQFLKTCIFGGFNKNDVDSYVGELVGHIKEIRSKF